MDEPDDDEIDTRDEDLIQNEDLRSILEIDAPGKQVANVLQDRFVLKGKFQDWVEIRIGQEWYVCSNYKPWRCIIHAICPAATGVWQKNALLTNEVLEGHGELANTWAGAWDEL